MTRTVELLLLTLSLLYATISCTASSPASIYIHPAAPGKGRAAEISAAQANQVLAHLLNVPGENLGAGAGHRDAWDWTTPTKNGKEAVQNLFDDSKQRRVVLFTDLDSDDAQDVFPSQLRQTHSLASPPHSSSFEALLHSYGERIHAATPALGAHFGGFFTSAVESIETILEGAADWVVDGALPVIGEKTVDHRNSGGKASATFRQSLEDLAAFFNQHSDNMEIDLPSYQALRFQGLGEIKSTYGSESDEYKQAKQMLRAVLEAAIDKINGFTQAASHRLAFIALPAEDGKLMPRSLDMLTPFRSSLSLTPFISTRDLSSLANNTKAPKESDFIGKCFSSESDLNKATLNCSSHGTPIQSSKGGAKCYRCKCQQTKSQKGRVTAWAGAACQKQDVSKPFVLLLSTTIGLMFVILGSVYYLFNEGGKELPSVLAGISIPNK